MHNERLQVLKMVEDGKITVDEATELLAALHATGGDPGISFEERFKDFTKDMKEFAKDVTCKVNELTKKAEPKIKEFTKTVAAKTANIADNISNSLNEAIKNMENCGCECECGCKEEAPADNGPRPEEQKESQE